MGHNAALILDFNWLRASIPLIHAKQNQMMSVECINGINSSCKCVLMGLLPSAIDFEMLFCDCTVNTCARKEGI